MKRLDLRTRLVAGLGLIALLQIVVAVLLVSATQSQLVDQIDTRLQESLSFERDFSNPTTERRQEPPGGGNAPGAYVERLGDTFEGQFADGVLQVYFAPNSTGQELSPPEIDAGSAERAAQQPITVNSVDGEVHYRISARVSPAGHYFITGIPLDGVDTTVARLRLVVALATAITMLVLALVALWVLRLGIAPIKRMTTTAGAIAAGDWSERVADADTGTEAGQLGAALNSMMGQIEASFDERVKSEERLRQFIADASHELRTPVSTIRGYAELYRSGGLGAQDDLDDAMRRTEEESKRMTRLIGDLLNLARLDQHPTLNTSPVDLTRLVSDAAADAQATQPERSVSVEVPSTPLVVNGDGDLLRQIIANLVGNALVHTDVDAALLLRASRHGAEIVVDVVDSGQGMPPEVAERVTERFYRADASRSRHRGGSGLGLSIVVSVLEAHGGTLTVDSTEGDGTTFKVRLPAAG